MAKRITVRNKAFTQGYICACATMMQEHGNGTEVEDCLRGNFISLDDLRKHEVDEHDIEVIMPIINEIERKRAWRRQKKQ
jgi:hypothetical protein